MQRFKGRRITNLLQQLVRPHEREKKKYKRRHFSPMWFHVMYVMCGNEAEEVLQNITPRNQESPIPKLQTL